MTQEEVYDALASSWRSSSGRFHRDEAMVRLDKDGNIVFRMWEPEVGNITCYLPGTASVLKILSRKYVMVLDEYRNEGVLEPFATGNTVALGVSIWDVSSSILCGSTDSEGVAIAASQVSGMSVFPPAQSLAP